MVMTDYNRSGAGRPEPFSKSIAMRNGPLLKLGSTSRGHRWTAEVVINNGRALGTLKCDGIVVRPFFNVGVSHTGRFITDICNGSGATVSFHTGSNVIE
jgi:hypothetical protein